MERLCFANSCRTLLPGNSRLLAPGYSGRFDGSVLDHLQLRLCETQQALESGLAASEHLRQLSRFPSVLPIQLALPDVRLPLDGPGISGALLATTPASLRSHFLPGCYNEDWIWLALLGRTGTAVRRAGVQAVHAALPQERITTDLVAYQCAGEIVYRAIREISDTWDGGCSLPEHCEASMNVAHFRRAKSSMASEISLAIQRLHELKRSPFREEDLVLAVAARAALCEMLSLFTSSMRWVESADPEALHRRSESYLRQIPLWKGLMLGRSRRSWLVGSLWPRLPGVPKCSSAAPRSFNKS